MTRRGAVGLHELWNRPSEEVVGFDVTFADGFEIRHAGCLAMLPHELIEQHGKVKTAEAY